MKYIAPNYNIEALEATDEIMSSWVSGIFSWTESESTDSDGNTTTTGSVEVDFDKING
ncbi:MAG: hypothetical protein IJW54_04550 [Clostridia bacterium]|nr:hypothetical protein [Clostridia bacterium]